MVAASDGLRGYLVKPQETPAGSILLLVDQIDAHARSASDDLARQGQIALAVAPETDTARAQTYLDGLPDTRGSAILCQRQAGC